MGDDKTTRSTVLVHGAGGAQGSSVVRAAVGAGMIVRGLTRDPADAERIERMGAQPVFGELDDPRSLELASRGVDAVALVLPLEYDEAVALRHARHAIDAAIAAGVQRIVLNTSSRFPSELTSVPSFEIKRRIVDYLAKAPVASTILRPTFYLENLLGPWTLPGILRDGVLAYPLPSTLTAAWLSLEDTARAVVAALQRPDLAGATLDVGGDRAVTGPDLAAALGHHLGRKVTYVEISPDAFEEALKPAVGPQAARGIAASYRWAHAQPQTRVFAPDPGVPALLGVSPTPLGIWVQQQRWALPDGIASVQA